MRRKVRRVSKMRESRREEKGTGRERIRIVSDRREWIVVAWWKWVE